jgi:hypothetical protein
MPQRRLLGLASGTSQGSKGYRVQDLFACVSGACWVSRLVPQGGYVGPEGRQSGRSKASGSRARHHTLVCAAALRGEGLKFRVSHRVGERQGSG